MSIERKAEARFSMFELEKAQAIDVLDRVSTRIFDAQRDIEAAEGFSEDWYGCQDAYNTVLGARNALDCKLTEVAAVNIDLAHLASILRDYDDYRGRRSDTSAVEWFARYFSNFNVDRDAFCYAAHYALKDADKLLVEEPSICEHCGGSHFAVDCPVKFHSEVRP